MGASKEIQFERNGFWQRLTSMLKVDFFRMFTMPFVYIMLGICFVMPILILVMTTMMDGMTTIDRTTGLETTIEGFDNVWQSISALSSEGMMSMDLTGMCNINMLYFFIAVLVGLFVAADFRSGYAKNLFTVRAQKGDYVISKTLVCFVGGALMLLAFFLGAMLGGKLSGLPFETEATAGEIVTCMLSKILLVAVFVPIFLAVSVAAKQKSWLSIVGSLCVGMLLFTMVPMITPLDASLMNFVLCLAGGALFSVGLGAVSTVILKKTSLV